MQKRIFSGLLGAIVAFMMMAQVALAQDVYVTKYGKKYHKEGSRFIKGKEVEKLSIEEAEERGYTPSSEFEKEATEDSDTSD